MTFDPNILYFKMAAYYHDHKNDPDKVIFCNEGSTRSSKTWDMFHFIVNYCDHNRGRGKDIYILRDTLINCRDFTLKEFEKCMKVIGIPFTPVFYPKPYFQLWGNNIYFRGLEDEVSMEGFPSHIAFVNEALDVNQNQIMGILMRCEDVFAMDWNPKYSDHWAFNFEKRPNCLFTHSTYQDNKFLPQSVINEIESYNPDLPINVTQGTADSYRWKVYGLGLRASPMGVYFPNVAYIDAFPEDIETVGYGMDFGHSISSTTLMKVGIKGNELYIECLFYAPCDDIPTLSEVIRKANPEMVLWADSAEPGMISDLRYQNISVFGSKNYPGVVQHGIASMNKYKIHAVRHLDLKREFENYKRREVGGVVIDEPIKGFCHAIDGARYAFMNTFRFE